MFFMKKIRLECSYFDISYKIATQLLSKKRIFAKKAFKFEFVSKLKKKHIRT